MTWKKLYQWMDLDRRCLLCAAPSGDEVLCHGCSRDLPRNLPSCPRCALPLPAGHRGLCAACLRHPPCHERVACSFRYAFPIDRLIHLAKYRQRTDLARALGCLMARHPPAWLRPADDTPTLLVPVPLHPLRQLLRGYNQAHELCLPLAETLGLRLEPGALRRIRYSTPQQQLRGSQRRRNLAGVFQAEERIVRGYAVLIVDDVMTTGTTLEAAARALKRAGAIRTEAWCLARTP